MIRAIWVMVVCLWAGLAAAQDFSGLARVLPDESGVEDRRGGLSVELALSQGVPYRVFTLNDPARLVMDFREVDWQGVDAGALDRSDRALALRMGGFRPGWSRMVVDMDGPYLPETVDLRVTPETGAARLEVVLGAADAEAFATAAGAPDLPGWELPSEGLRAERRPRQRGEDPLMVVVDPGHGGIDPGAEAGGVAEKDLMLQFARELKEMLLRAGGMEVILTRTDDSFVSLERRVAVAHRVQADIFISLHADALREGRAHGATVYTLSDSASDAASAALAERHNRADMLAGVDLRGSDDVVADVLMDLARMETQPRAERLAKAVRLSLAAHDLPLHSRPLRHAGFSVLKSPDIPSVLVELGFLSSERDRANLRDAGWRGRMGAALRDAIAAWRQEDAARADLVRQ
ncbi:N-acetylmuramoyl-L-alanine amidase [Roseovarius sp. A21]|uniref:N-acetylmuramoyl-L-alanine amidase n=1 Tax=Roseovarius bejariae TaxID=2576383 RepID=A0A844CUE2_9RHOB|nr:N-acetylmuramoyl-L-alanine amidase [Roseovarius bejariae]MRU14310.1 N-acetylmuramoyl-L-alanine amidase [Roseovarius bejariae]